MSDYQVSRYAGARIRLDAARAQLDAATREHDAAIRELETAGSALAERILINQPAPLQRSLFPGDHR
jgi:hypothetical protein